MNSTQRNKTTGREAKEVGYYNQLSDAVEGPGDDLPLTRGGMQARKRALRERRLVPKRVLDAEAAQVETREAANAARVSAATKAGDARKVAKVLARAWRESADAKKEKAAKKAAEIRAQAEAVEKAAAAEPSPQLVPAGSDDTDDVDDILD